MEGETTNPPLADKLTRKETIMSKTTKPKKEETKSPGSNQELFSDINVSMKTGHLTKDAEVIADGRYAKVRFASNKEYQTPEGEIRTNTNYFNVLVSSNLTDAFEVTKQLKKGDWAYFKGEDSTKSFDTPEGYKQTASTIFAYHVVLKKEKVGKSDNDNAEPVLEVSNEPEAIPA
ncbi:MAG: single-stranded DNA-binding protein [Reichenbachiella sp.]|uniref:single-stranded DNA-binding protein n=1 Tax=Reichenbachiella sp. TaxID=2184521 RepID=UPI0032641106